jgi:PAS domain S-box-containing protein
MLEFNAHVRPVARGPRTRRYRAVTQPPAPAYRPPAGTRRMHRLLRSQLRRKLGLADAAHMRAALAAMAALSRRVQDEDPATARVLAGVGALLDDVAAAYAHHDLNATLLQRSLDLTAEEWFAANERLRRELAVRSCALETLRNAISSLLRENGRCAGGDADDIEQLVGELANLARERSLAEEQLRLWRTAFEASREGIVITDGQERILSANSAVAEITGYAEHEILGKTPRLFSSGRHDKEYFRAMWAKLDADGRWQGEIWDRRKNGDVYPKWLAISAVRDRRGAVTHYVASFSDITERKRNEERTRHIADRHALTGHGRIAVGNCLRGALERGELSIHYQPQVNLKSGGIVGVEALLRWTSPELGEVAPARFIPVAEDSGMILEIGAWVLREACRAARAWHEGGWQGLTVAVNLSAVQFRRGDLAGTLAHALDESGVVPGCIELELTESTLVEEAEATLATLRRLKECGVRLSIDDFGTGYSSLAYLKRFAVDRLKIDRSFVAGLPEDSDDAAIVTAVIQMAHSLKLAIVAEGVETEAQAAFLRRAGCEQAQGYLYGRPEAAPQALAAPPRTHLRVLGD